MNHLNPQWYPTISIIVAVVIIVCGYIYKKKKHKSDLRIVKMIGVSFILIGMFEGLTGSISSYIYYSIIEADSSQSIHEVGDDL